MPPKKAKQKKASEELANIIDCSAKLRELLVIDARTATLAQLILQRDGYYPQEQESTTAEIATDIAKLHDALSQHYGISLTIPLSPEVTEMRHDLLRDVESGSMWLSPGDTEILARSDPGVPELTAHIRDALSTQSMPNFRKANELNQFMDRVVSPLLRLSGQQLEDDIRDYVRRVVLAVEAERHAQHYHALSAEEQEAWMRHEFTQQVKDRIVDIRNYAVLRMARNWIAPGEQRPARHAEGTLYVKKSSGSPPPPGESPTLTLTIDLSKVHLVGVTEIAQKVALAVKESLTKLPPAWDTFPPDLGFLRTISQEDFERDIQRFKRYTKGLSRRQIALLEEAERRGRPLPSSLQQHTVGKSIRGEDGVEKAVKKIATAIAQAPREYFCQAHPRGDCSLDCPTIVAYYQAVERELPKATTGRGKGIVS